MAKKFNPGAFLSPKFESKEFETVDGKRTLHFYPISMVAGFRLKKMSGPISKVIVGFFSKTAQDAGQKYVTTTDEKTGYRVVESSQESIAPNLAKYRAGQREEAIKETMEMLLEPSNAAVLGFLLMNSLREDFPRNETPSEAEAEDFISQLEPGVLAEMLEAFYETNKKQFAPLAKRVIRKMQSEMALFKDDSPTTNNGDKSETESSEQPNGDLTPSGS